MSGISSRVVTALRNLNRYGTKWMRTQAPHWTTADSLALALEDKMRWVDYDRMVYMEDGVKKDLRTGEPIKKTTPQDCHCAQEGWVQTDTQDPDVWAELTEHPQLYGSREEWPPYDTEERPITLMVIEDLLARDKMGHEKHGRPLTKSTYTDFHKELYEELMDALVYLRALRENEK